MVFGVYSSAVFSATVLPGGSGGIVLGVLKLYPEQYSAALTVVTLGNTAGGMTT